MKLRAPFPWFGGKSRVSHIVWDYFGDVRNYVEPFAGSLAVLLGRPTGAKIETVNDLDCWIANFWRALQASPQLVATYADWPVNETDLHARHLWLVKQTEFRERMKTDPEYFDPKIAGWWVWGISQWIGSGWCSTQGTPTQKEHGRADGTPVAGRPFLNGSQGVHIAQKRPYLTNHGGGMGVHGGRKRPRLGNDHGRGVLNAQVPNQIPDLSGDSGAAGRGVHASGMHEKMPSIGGRPWGMMSETGMDAKGGLYEWMFQLSDRLRRVRVCCGDWKRIVGPAPTTCIGTTAVFLDPPYAVEDRSDVYGEESRDVAHEVRKWAIENGDNPGLRIALCGYDEHEAELPASWSRVYWKANGGFSNQKKSGTRGQENARRETLYFSPHCLRPQQSLFYQEPTA